MTEYLTVFPETGDSFKRYTNTALTGSLQESYSAMVFLKLRPGTAFDVLMESILGAMPLHPFFNGCRKSRHSSEYQESFLIEASHIDEGHTGSVSDDESEKMRKPNVQSLEATSDFKQLTPQDTRAHGGRQEIVPEDTGGRVKAPASRGDWDSSGEKAQIQQKIQPSLVLAYGSPGSKESDISGSSSPEDSLLDSDLNFDRRKRRKTVPPGRNSSSTNIEDLPNSTGTEPETIAESKDPWLQQLEIAAYPHLQDDQPGPTLSEHSNSSITTEFQEQASTPSVSNGSSSNIIVPRCGRTDTITMSRNAGTTETGTSLPSSVALSVPLAHRASAKDQTSGMKTAPEKRLVKLNGRGRLVYPSTSDPDNRPEAASAKSHGGTKEPSKTEDLNASRKARRKRQKMSLFAKLRYGDDELSKKRVGEEINSIQQGSGPKTVACHKAEQPPRSDKPTHPFFLEKTGHQAEVRQGAGQKTSASAKEALARNIPRQLPLTDNIGDAPSKLATAPSHQITPKGALTLSSADDNVGPKLTTTRQQKYPASEESPWPGKDCVHIRGLDHPHADNISGSKPISKNQFGLRAHMKLKNPVVEVREDEDIICFLMSQLRSTCGRPLNNLNVFEDGRQESSNHPRLPQRHIATGEELQRLVRQELYTTICDPLRKSDPDQEECPHHSKCQHDKFHPAISSVLESIKVSLSAFDKHECDFVPWVSKYSPKSAREVLQPGREALVLSDWLRRLVVESVQSGNHKLANLREGQIYSKQTSATNDVLPKSSKKKRRKMDEDLEDFIISSDEEDNQMSELTRPGTATDSGSNAPTKNTLIRARDVARISDEGTGKVANAVVISGPHGCGKSAAALAVAKELGFEVFEINPGSRRSGKDIIDKVGDMTRNHLVHRSNHTQDDNVSEDESVRGAETLRKDIETGRQGTMNTFFKSQSKKAKQRAKSLKSPVPTPTPPSESDTNPHQQKHQKQSLILLEEVDVLFEEDKQFWSTVLTLITQSRRPIIMTCNDESLLPMDDLSLHAVLRFAPPPEHLGVDYLLLLAANEGHWLQRDAIQALYKSKDMDLRASIMELDFWCQMAIGDRKGGLEWMLPRWPPGEDVNDSGQKLRVISKDTYTTGMGWLSHEATEADTLQSWDEEFAIEAWERFGIDVEDWDHTSIDSSHSIASQGFSNSAGSQYELINNYEAMVESLSAQDVYTAHCQSSPHNVRLDLTLPPLPEKIRLEYIQGFPLLEAEPKISYSQLTPRLAMNTKSLARETLRHRSGNLLGQAHAHLKPLNQDDVINIVSRRNMQVTEYEHLTRHDLVTAFDPISEPPTTSLALQTGYQISAFDRPISVITEDLAPYVRSIVSYDLFLEDERLRMSNLLSQGKRDGKRIRTTRASRSALEGGNRSNTRRDRWFEGNLSSDLVLKTGGKRWQKIALERPIRAHGDEQTPEDVGSSVRPSSRPASVGDMTSVGEIVMDLSDDS
ncbi:MAG: hypothetical protein M1837_002986 [Sclerophora amabilis]|nr:MAG: hypothetical protein M1837_002986 [Sclerophora amabilis]